MSGDKIIEIKNLNLTLDGHHILNDLSIDIWKGSIHALVGSNGAGKSTLSNTIMGLADYRDFGGDILFEGKSIKNLDISERAKLGITLAWQEPARFEGLTIENFIRLSAKEKTDAVIDDALIKSGLNPAKYRKRAVDKSLSGGERKKVELASLLAMRPKFVMMDEPDSGIDVISLEHIFEALKFLKGYGATVVLITHSTAVLAHAEHAFLMCNGRLLKKGMVSDIKHYFEDACLPCSHPNAPVEGELDQVAEGAI